MCPSVLRGRAALEGFTRLIVKRTPDFHKENRVARLTFLGSRAVRSKHALYVALALTYDPRRSIDKP